MAQSSDDATRRAALQACRTLLAPVASLMMKCGVTWREFSQLSKAVFVAVASREYGLRGRPTNISRVAILTGINRKEVARQRDLLQVVTEELPSKTTDATRVLSGWHQDPDFLDSAGKPRVLAEEGTGATVAELCRRYAGDIPASAMLKELRRVGAVAPAGAGWTVLRRYYMPVKFESQWILNAGSILQDLGASLSHNLNVDDRRPSRFVGRATNDAIDPAAIPEFREFVEANGQAFLEKVDAWLTAHQLKNGETPKAEVSPAKARLGIGLFWIQD